MFAAALMLLAGGPAPAPPSPTGSEAAAVVQWSAPSSCPDATAARTTIAAPLGAQSTLTIRVAVEAAAPGYRARVAIRAPAGETTRELSTPNCATLVDTVALIAAAAKQDQHDVAPPTTGPATVPEPDPMLQLGPAERRRLQRELAADAARLDADDATRERPPDDAPAPPPTPRRRRSVAAHARGFGLVGAGVTPVVDAGGGGALGLSVRRFRAEALVRAVAATEVTIDALPTAAARVRGWSVGARGCGIVWASASEAIALPLCAGASVGQVVGAAAGTGLAEPAPRRQLWMAVHAGPGFVLRVARWVSLVADADLLVPVLRPGFSVQGVTDDVHRVAPVGVWGTIGVELHFPRRIFKRAGMP